MRSRLQSDSGENVLSLSFLDVLCCGLGASVLLFMIFAVMPHFGRAGAGAQTAPLAGRSATAMGAGVVLPDVRELARFAVVRLELTARMGEAEARQIVIRGLPSKAIQFSVVDSASGQAQIVAVVEGIPDVGKPWTVEVPAALTNGGIRDLELHATVGAWPRPRTKVPFPTARSGDRLVVARIRFDQANWVELATPAP